MQPADSKDNVTWKWLVGVLLALALTFGGYSYKATDTRSIANAQRIVELDVEIQQEKVRSAIQYTEIQRQLGELQRSVDRVEQLVRQRRF